MFHIYFFRDIWYRNIVFISDTNINRYRCISLWIHHIMVNNMFCDAPLNFTHDIICYQQSIILAGSHHWNCPAKTCEYLTVMLRCDIIKRIEMGQTKYKLFTIK